MTLPTKLLTACMASKHHAFFDWSPHVDWITVYAYSAETVYGYGIEREYLLEPVNVFQNDDDGIEKLIETVEGLG